MEDKINSKWAKVQEWTKKRDEAIALCNTAWENYVKADIFYRSIEGNRSPEAYKALCNARQAHVAAHKYRKIAESCLKRAGTLYVKAIGGAK